MGQVALSAAVAALAASQALVEVAALPPLVEVAALPALVEVATVEIFPTWQWLRVAALLSGVSNISDE